MIITRSPLRISIGGGGTDLPSYYEKFGGFVISAAIDRYVYVTMMKPFVKGIYLKYSKLERTDRVSDIQHPIMREALSLFYGDNSADPQNGTAADAPQIEITTLADIPAGTGLGSSGSFSTALLKALYAFNHKMIPPNELAELACDIEINKLGQPVGKQDQYIAAFGGLTCMEFSGKEPPQVYPLHIDPDTLYDLEDNLLLFFTGFSRDAGTILRDQNERSKNDDNSMFKNLHYVKELGLRCKTALETGRCADFGALMHEHWENKRKRSGGMSNGNIDEWYALARANGALGGKLVGAGGGGFLMFYAEDRSKLRQAMRHAGLQEVRFHFDFDGTKSLL